MIPEGDIEFNHVDPFTAEMRLVDPAILWVDDRYQRTPTTSSIKLVKKVVANWSWASFKPPIVTEYEDGSLFVIDGQHTAMAALTHPEITKIPVFVVPIETQKLRATSFISHNTSNTKVTDIQIFRSRLEAGDDDAVSIDMALQRSGVKLSNNLAFNSTTNTCSSIKTLYTLYSNYGVRALRICLDVCVASKLAPIQSHFLYAVSDLLFKPEYRDKYIAANIATVIRSVSMYELAGDIVSESQKKKIKKTAATVSILRHRYIRMFGNPEIETGIKTLSGDNV